MEVNIQVMSCACHVISYTVVACDYCVALLPVYVATSRRCEEELREIDSIWTQRLQKLKQRKEYSTVKVIHWLRQNQHKFQQPIFEPVCMSLNIRKPRYAKQAEAFFSGRDFYSFVAQNEEDREKFLREVRNVYRAALLLLIVVLVDTVRERE